MDVIADEADEDNSHNYSGADMQNTSGGVTAGAGTGGGQDFDKAYKNLVQ